MKIFYTTLLILFTSSIFCQEKIISGTVIDDFGNPIEGASIYTDLYKTNKLDQINQEALGTTSNDLGMFSFSVPEEITAIVVSYIGYEKEIVDISTQTEDIFVVLSEKNQILNELVVTGYKKIEQRKATSSHKTIKIEEIKQSTAPNIDQMLTGQIAGVQVAAINGAPGTPSKINIRGTASLNGTSDPLWVLDGIPLEGENLPQVFDKDNIDDLKSFPIASINPEDIESITVLKDASATSIYGARAANGVIVITTKKGKEGKPRINFSVNTAYTFKPNISNLNLMNSNEKVDFELFLASRKDLSHESSKGSVAAILNKNNEYQLFQQNGLSALSQITQEEINNLRNTSTNWADQIYQNNYNSNYSFSVSGGSNKSDYYFSLGMYDEQGSTIGSSFKRYNISVKNNFKLTDKLTVGTALFYNRNRKEGYVTGVDGYTNPAQYIRRVSPYLQLVDDNNDYIYDPNLIERSNQNLNFNLQEERNNTSYELISNSIKPMLDAKYKFNSKFNIYSQLGLQYDFNNTEKIALENSYFVRKVRFASRYFDASNGGYNYFMPEGGIIQNTDDNAFQYNWKTLLNYNSTFALSHEVDIMVGNELRRNNRDIISTKAFGFDENTLRTIPIIHEQAVGSSTFSPYSKNYSENAFVSWFGTASYTFKRKYTLFTSLRYDGSNLFGVSRKYRYLPIWSVAGSWNAIDENFLKEHKTISDLRVRASYGIQGNIDKSTSPFVIGIYDDSVILPGNNEDIIRANNAPNKNLRWEKTISSNLGFDLGLNDNKVYITADLYARKSQDLIGLRTLPLESGFGIISDNWASMTNHGIELNIKTNNIQRENFSWTTNFNIAHNRNKVTDIEESNESLRPSKLGRSISAVWGIKTQGVDPNGNPILVKNGQAMSVTEFYKLNEGINGSQLSREEHRALYTYLGDENPLLSGGIGNNFKYKNFSLRISANYNLLQTKKGQPLYHNTLGEPGYNYNRTIINAGQNGYPGLIGYTSPGLQTDLVYRWYFGSDDGNTYGDLDYWIKTISFIRINNIAFGYNLQPKRLERMGLSNMQFTLEGRNLFVFGSSYKGFFDPETYGSSPAQPIPQSIALGLKISF